MEKATSGLLGDGQQVGAKYPLSFSACGLPVSVCRAPAQPRALGLPQVLCVPWWTDSKGKRVGFLSVLLSPVPGSPEQARPSVVLSLCIHMAYSSLDHLFNFGVARDYHALFLCYLGSKWPKLL